MLLLSLPSGRRGKRSTKRRKSLLEALAMLMKREDTRTMKRSEVCFANRTTSALPKESISAHTTEVGLFKITRRNPKWLNKKLCTKITMPWHTCLRSLQITTATAIVTRVPLSHLPKRQKLKNDSTDLATLLENKLKLISIVGKREKGRNLRSELSFAILKRRYIDSIMKKLLDSLRNILTTNNYH